MASKIIPGDVDGTYPKAGQDNSSQGMRDNFNAIKNNFTEAKSEIDDLQTNKANLNASSDFADNEVRRPKIIDASETVYPHGTTSGTVVLNHANGHYQTLTTNGTVTLSFTNMGPIHRSAGQNKFNINQLKTIDSSNFKATATVRIIKIDFQKNAMTCFHRKLSVAFSLKRGAFPVGYR